MRLNATITAETASSGVWAAGLRHEAEVRRDRIKIWSSSSHLKNPLWQDALPSINQIIFWILTNGLRFAHDLFSTSKGVKPNGERHLCFHLTDLYWALITANVLNFIPYCSCISIVYSLNNPALTVVFPLFPPHPLEIAASLSKAKSAAIHLQATVKLYQVPPAGWLLLGWADQASQRGNTFLCLTDKACCPPQNSLRPSGSWLHLDGNGKSY